MRPLTSVIRTIARDLANWDPTFRRALASVLHAQGNLAGSVDITKQWEGLILEPLKKVALVGPVLVVIDAFDECSAPDAPLRWTLLTLLAERSTKLPTNFRILITSRPEAPIETVFAEVYRHLIMDDTALAETGNDIRRYYEYELANVPRALPYLPDLLTAAEGLFQWAFVACTMIVEGENPDLPPSGEDMRSTYTGLLALTGGELDALYLQLLSRLFPENYRNQGLLLRLLGFIAEEDTTRQSIHHHYP